MLRARGIDLIAADSPSSFLDDTPTARLIRQVLGAVSEFEKAMLVAKLRGARDRKRRTGVKVEGRKSIAEEKPETVELARKLARTRPKGGKRSLREISAALAEAGHLTKAGQPLRRDCHQVDVEREVTRKLGTSPSVARQSQASFCRTTGGRENFRFGTHYSFASVPRQLGRAEKRKNEPNVDEVNAVISTAHHDARQSDIEAVFAFSHVIHGTAA